jgi:hypothetical protein
MLVYQYCAACAYSGASAAQGAVGERVGTLTSRPASNDGDDR